MSDDAPLILIADDSAVSREHIANLLVPAGYRVIQAIDGGSAFKVVDEHNVALAIIDHYMQPYGGLEFARGLRALRVDLPMIMVTNEETSDLLIEVSKAGIGSYLKKPADPKRLLETVRRALRHVAPAAAAPAVLASSTTKTHHTPDEIMQRVLEMAKKNAETGHGGPFAAIVVDAQGKIIGEGTHGTTARADPIAHAEVMAIRQATERLNKTSLEGCILYSASEPTKIGKALIDSVDIGKVYYGLSHADINALKPARVFKSAEYIQFKRDDAIANMAT